MRTAKAGLDIIKKFEGLKLQSYKCPAGVWTIGYGSTKNIKPNMSISEIEAHNLLLNDVRDAENAVNKFVKVPLTQNEFDALVSFVFNLGSGTLQKSTLLKKLNAGDKDGASNEILRFCRAGDIILVGLEKRRKAERELFLKG